MPRKTIIIFITTFIIVGIIILGIYFWINKKDNATPDTTTPWYQGFNPFGAGDNTNTNPTDPNNNTDQNDTGDNTPTFTSKFTQITDFAISGATFLEDTRLVANNNPTTPSEIKTTINPDTKEGRKEIQNILNQTLSLNPPLVVDGNFGKKAVQAIKDFQELKSIPVTGIIDADTAPHFTKTVTSNPIKDSFEQVSSIRFVERMNGHIYKMFLDTKTKEKISNSTIPSIYESFFDRTANTVIYRYLGVNNVISSFIATLGETKGDFLPQDISDISISRDGNKFFYLVENSNGVVGTVGVFGSGSKEVVFNSPLTEWLSQWDNKGRIFLTTKPSYGSEGSMFFLDTSRKTISKLFGGIAGLTTIINGKGTHVLYSTSSDTGPQLSVIDLSKHLVKDLNAYGLPEKCVWGGDGITVYCAVPNTINGNQYPDLWYQGLESFNDYFIKINIETGDKTTIANSIDETRVDATYLFLDKTESTLFFTNKKDSTLWSLDVR